MKFLDPRYDRAFKRLFGEPAHENLAIDFLNAVLERPEGSKITQVLFGKTNNVADGFTPKLSSVDVNCRDQQGNEYIVEMQWEKQKDYCDRAQYYTSLNLSRQLKQGETYDKLLPVIFVAVLDFTLFEEPDYISHHAVVNLKTHSRYFNLTEYHIIELPKFTKKLNELDGVLDKWVAFFKDAVNFEEVPPQLKTPIFQEAFQVLVESNWSRDELYSYFRHVDALRQEKSIIETALEEGEKQGLLKAARSMLDMGLTVEVISAATGLPIKEIKTLISK